MRLTLMSLIGFAIVGCAQHTGSGGADAGSGTPNIVGLTVTPSAALVALTAVGTGYSATQPFVVTATYEDGTTADVTTQTQFAVANTDPGDDALVIDHGTATVTAAGHYHLIATVNTSTADATLDATLDGLTLGAGFDAADQTKLDGTSTAAAPTIAYPLAGSLFPVNVAPIAVQVTKTDPAQQLARIDFVSGVLLKYRYYAPCAPSPNPGTFANACIISITGDFAPQLAGVSATDDVSLSVRLVALDGTHLGESAPIALAWAKTKLTGGLYYWTTAGTGDTTFNTAIARYNFTGDTSMPSIFLSSADAPTVPSGQSQCIGCHSISPDGTRMGFSLGGSLTGFFSDYDVASKTPMATKMPTAFASMSTFSPDGSNLVTMLQGELTMTAGDADLTKVSTAPLFPEVTEKKSHAFWSPSGQKLAFVSWTPSQADISSQHTTGDMVQGGQVWIADMNGTSTGMATSLVPRVANTTSFYPAISDDDHFVVFNQSSCTGPANGSSQGWGAGACDGYNDISATLHLISTDGGTPVALTNANGGTNPLTTNSWPRWSPDHGTFRGKRLYWVAYSSRRGYGLSLASGAGADATKPQLWFAAVAVDESGAMPTTDPSFAPIWLPGQDPSFTGPRGNHTPAWTSKVVVLQ